MRRLQQRAPGRRLIRGKAAFLKKTALAAAFLAVPAGILSGCGTKEAETFSVTNFVYGHGAAGDGVWFGRCDRGYPGALI